MTNKKQPVFFGEDDISAARSKTFRHYLLDGKVLGQTFVDEDGEKYKVLDIYPGRKDTVYIDLGKGLVRSIGRCLDDIKFLGKED